MMMMMECRQPLGLAVSIGTWTMLPNNPALHSRHLCLPWRQTRARPTWNSHPLRPPITTRLEPRSHVSPFVILHLAKPPSHRTSPSFRSAALSKPHPAQGPNSQNAPHQENGPVSLQNPGPSNGFEMWTGGYPAQENRMYLYPLLSAAGSPVQCVQSPPTSSNLHASRELSFGPARVVRAEAS